MNNRALTISLLMISACFSQQTLAFGMAKAVTGNVAIINVDGNTRALQQGGRIEARETIVTGDAAEALIKTDDDGVMLIKSNSQFLVESFSAKGNAQDNFAVKLLKGAFRGVTGFIGKTAPKHYRVKTLTATIGIRGTDYELEITQENNLYSTFAKVNAGEISVTNRGISVNVLAKQFASAPANAPPQLLDEPPAGLFKPSQLEAQTQELIDVNASGKALSTRQDEQLKGGGSAATGETRIPNNCAGNNEAQRTLDAFIAAYERADVAYIQRRLDPAMIGYGTFLNAMMDDMNAQKQIRFLIQNRNVQCGSDLAVINFRWEKRYLDLTTFAPRLEAGQASVRSYLKAGEWRLSGIVGDNPFASSLNNNATLTLALTQASFASFPQTCGPSPTSTLSGTATATQPLLGLVTPPNACPPSTVGSCSIAGFTGVVSGVATCTSNPITTTPYSATGTIPFSSTGTANSNTSVTVAISVTGNSGNGQTASGSLSCTTTITYPTGSPVCTVTPFIAGVGITLTSQNLVGVGSAQVEAIASNGDREVFVLNDTSGPAGTLKKLGFNVAGGPVVPNNGVITINGPMIVTFRYIDPKTGNVTTSVFNVTP
jgi:FecR protein